MKLSAIISTKKIDTTPERIARQNKCIEGWHDYAHRIILLNRAHDVADMKYVETVEPVEANPTLEKLINTAAAGRGMFDHDSIAIMPSDVELVGNFDKLEAYIKLRQVVRAWAATSHRFEAGLEIEWAFDMFIATKKVWRELRDIPTYYKMGQPMWDIWINGKFSLHVGGHRYLNLSPMKVVNHEAHEGGRDMSGVSAGRVQDWAAPDVTP
ncbi:MAG: hypothetical protein MUP44_08795 [Anaerolineales bacterium]|nr:hypothetical protein [Anaerolineales bacterium]